jgi:fatty acid desaturase
MDGLPVTATAPADSECQPAGAAEESLPIPNGLNLALSAVVVGLAIALMWLGSRVDSWLGLLAIGIVFSYVLLSNYALLHEAVHHNLNSRRTVNYLLGVLTGAFFPVPFTLIETTHQGHHLRNRTDFEMFDLYYPGDQRLLKVAQWYSILCGLFWPLVPLGAVAAAAWPGLFRLGPFRRARSSNYLLGDLHGADLWRIRAEVVAMIGLFSALFVVLHLKWSAILLLYACFAFNWSTRQYVGHAFSRRHVVEGAWNLRHNKLMSWILLHGEWDLNHHRRPDVSWLYLPRMGRADDVRPGYVRQYWRQWRGPRLAEEPAPESMESLPLSVHDACE